MTGCRHLQNKILIVGLKQFEEKRIRKDVIPGWSKCLRKTILPVTDVSCFDIPDLYEWMINNDLKTC